MFRFLPRHLQAQSDTDALLVQSFHHLEVMDVHGAFHDWLVGVCENKQYICTMYGACMPDMAPFQQQMW